MGVVLKLKPSRDPERFRLDDRAKERRLERLFGDQRQQLDLSNTLQARADATEAMLEAMPNTTTGTTDKALSLAGSRGIRGTRTQAVEKPEDAFTQWTASVTFAAAYPSPPVVVLTPLTSAPEGIAAVLTAVSTTGFMARLSCPAAQQNMTFHWQAWGDS